MVKQNKIALFNAIIYCGKNILKSIPFKKIKQQPVVEGGSN